MDLREIPIALVEMSAFNTRKELDAGEDDAGLDELAASIKEHGLLNPVTVSQTTSGKYELIAGQRRLLAVRKLEWETIPANVRPNMGSGDATAISLIENVQRADMNPRDKARAFRALLDQYAGDEKAVCRATGVTTQTVRKYLGLLKLAPPLQILLAAGEAKNTQALADLAGKYDDPQAQTRVYDELKGFTQDVQREMIRTLDTDLANLEAVVVQAHEGVFNAKLVRHCPFDCPTIPANMKQEVDRLIHAGRSLPG